MRFKLFAFIWFAALAAAPMTLSADDGCCDKAAAACCDGPAMACCDKPAASCCNEATKAKCDMPCCKDGAQCEMPCCKGSGDLSGDAVEMLIEMDGQAVLPLTQETPTRQTALVLFQRPVWVGQTVLMGKYIIEHDTERQARGEPCTHIYAFKDRTIPVVAFHCTHLEGERNEKAVVVLESLPNGQQRLVQFQFAGDIAAHGYPTDR
jgi:hypothetical protein